jgi:hypothetical protein
MTALQIIVEDSYCNAAVVALYNASSELQARLTVGVVFDIRNPYRRICRDARTQVRVDEPEQNVTVHSELLQLCWSCLCCTAELKSCARTRGVAAHAPRLCMAAPP